MTRKAPQHRVMVRRGLRHLAVARFTLLAGRPVTKSLWLQWFSGMRTPQQPAGGRAGACGVLR